MRVRGGRAVIVRDEGGGRSARSVVVLMRHRLFYHAVWTTRERKPLIDRAAALFLSHFIPAITRAERGDMIELGIVRTHVHVLLELHPCAVIPRLMQKLKGGSAVIINREYGNAAERFGWAAGYNLETVSPRSLTAARDYIRHQPEHHRSEAIPGWDLRSHLHADGPSGPPAERRLQPS